MLNSILDQQHSFYYITNTSIKETVPFMELQFKKFLKLNGFKYNNLMVGLKPTNGFLSEFAFNFNHDGYVTGQWLFRPYSVFRGFEFHCTSMEQLFFKMQHHNFLSTLPNNLIFSK